jgi:hypothetical protein
MGEKNKIWNDYLEIVVYKSYRKKKGLVLLSNSESVGRFYMIFCLALLKFTGCSEGIKAICYIKKP